MPFQEKQFMQPIRDFLVSYPAWQPYGYLEIDYMKIDPSTFGPSSSVAFSGNNRIDKRKNVIGYGILNEQANFILTIRRFTNDNELRRDIGDFIFNYIRWINYENEMRGTPEENPLLPHFSDTEQEQITANGGMEMGPVENQAGVDDFSLQIQLSYQTIY